MGIVCVCMCVDVCVWVCGVAGRVEIVTESVWKLKVQTWRLAGLKLKHKSQSRPVIGPAKLPNTANIANHGL